MSAGVSVLNVEDRVVPRLLDHLGKIEIKDRVVLPVEHHEADGILADFVDHLAQGDEIAGALGHLYGFAVTQESHELDDLHVQAGLPGRHRLDRRLDALDVAAMVGAPDIDQIAEAAIELVLVIGDVGGEISVAAIGFQKWPIDIIAVSGGTKQRLLAVLVVIDRSALWRRQTPLINVTFGAQEDRKS